MPTFSVAFVTPAKIVSHRKWRVLIMCFFVYFNMLNI